MRLRFKENAMKSLFAWLAIMVCVAFAGAVLAQDKPAATQAKADEAKPAAAAATPVPNKGDVAWMLLSTALVIMMSVPALALFYGGMVRAKNALSVLMQVFVVFSLVTV